MRLSRKNKFIFSLVTVCLLLLSTWITGKNPQELFQLAISPTPQQSVQGVQTDNPGGKQEAKIVKVVDGDTIHVELNGKKEKVRVIGINTPETVDPRKGVECMGKEASTFAKETLIEQTVYLEVDPSQSERDRYGRLLRFVWLNQGTVDFGKLQISEGYAHEYTYEVPHKYQREYQDAEKKAQEAKKGLWGKAC